jgi:SAM-dependent MidA family methyltransferase
MGSCASDEFLRRFAAEPDAAYGVSFARFMELALYDPAVGYYTRARRRIGRAPAADFMTATSVGAVFGELVTAACARLLAPRAPRDFVFVEVGAEPGAGVLQGVAHAFGGAEVRRLGEPLTLPARCVVFSNELFDAQPCHRLVWRGGAWRELGVALVDDKLREVEMPAWSAEVAAMGAGLPAEAAEGYLLDLPLHAVGLIETLAAQPWEGLLVAIDYGKTWRQLSTETPAGTVRAYARHHQTGDLLAQPGGQDLTCHVCWDWLEEALRRHGFAVPRLESQESFLTHHAGEVLSAIVAEEAGRTSARKQAVVQLLHPGNMGQKFQVLRARRAGPADSA